MKKIFFYVTFSVAFVLPFALSSTVNAQELPPDNGTGGGIPIKQCYCNIGGFCEVNGDMGTCGVVYGGASSFNCGAGSYHCETIVE